MAAFQYITKAGEVAFPTKCLWAGWFWKGTACVHSESFGWGFIDTEGTLKVRLPDFQSEPTEFFDVCMFFSDGLLAFEHGGKWGYMDRSGRCVIPEQFDVADIFRNGLAPVAID